MGSWVTWAWHDATACIVFSWVRERAAKMNSRPLWKWFTSDCHFKCHVCSILDIQHQKKVYTWALVAHASNCNYLGGRNPEVAVWGQPEQIVSETLSWKNHHIQGLVEWLKVWALSTNPSIEKKGSVPQSLEENWRGYGRVIFSLASWYSAAFLPERLWCAWNDLSSNFPD
jgi:hypothetical protein